MRKLIQHAGDVISGLRRDQKEPLVLMRSIWNRISEDIVSLGGGKFSVPYGGVKVSVFAHNEGEKQIFQSSLEADKKLQNFIREKLKEENCESADRFAVSVDYVYTRPNAWGQNIFSLTPDALPTTNAKQTNARLVILKGKTPKKRYTISKKRTYIGRLRDVKDVHGRIVRRNDVVFEDAGDRINSSVGRLHASIEFDADKERFILEDTSGRTETRIERAGEFLEVRLNQKVRLKNRDIIHLGRASMEFLVDLR